LHETAHYHLKHKNLLNEPLNEEDRNRIESDANDQVLKWLKEYEGSEKNVRERYQLFFNE